MSDFKLGRLHVHAWKPMHPVRFGTRTFGSGTRTVSFRWFLVRWFRVKGRAHG